MAENSKIEWTDHTFNPRIGCQVASPDGCANCYAADWAKRYGRDFAQRTRTSDANWKQPLKWNAQAQGRRYRVFCASLADVFDNQAPDEWRADLFELIRRTPRLDWLLLTKRIGNAASMLDEAARLAGYPGWDWRLWRHVWIGATVVDQTEADRDVPKLLQVPAEVRFLSIEPMLGPIDLGLMQRAPLWYGDGPGAVERSATGRALHWVICGGESGPKARPMHPDWARSLRDQCEAAGVPFLFKQHGEWLATTFCDDEAAMLPIKRTVYVYPDGHFVPLGEPLDFFAGVEETAWVGKKAAGRLLDGRTHDGFPR